MTAPKQLLVDALQLHAHAYLSGQHFRFSESGLKYSRSQNGFRQEIIFRGSKNNMAGAIADFQPNFVIYSAAYKRWHTAHFPGLPVIGGGYIGGDRSAWKHYDRSLQPGFGYDLIRQDHELIVLNLLRNIQQVALPFFEQNNSWDKIADGNDVQDRERVDALLLAQRPEEALARCSASLAWLEEHYGAGANPNYLQPITYMRARKAYLDARLA